MRNGPAPDDGQGGQGRRGARVRRAITGTPRRTILLIALLTAVFSASVALAAGWLAGVIGALAGSLVAYAATEVASRREATERSAREAAIAAAQRAAVEVAVAALGERDGATADHSDDVVELAAALADRMRVDDEERRRLLVAAQLHDLGKVAIPTEILHKPGPLDDDEWEVMRTHTPVGERILRSVPELADVATIVRHSHEHYDGSGYPDGLAGHQIPISSRIILCADAYHAIRSNRPYRAGRSAGEALIEIRTCAGRQFDPQVAAALEHAAKDARRGGALRGASLAGSRRLAALLLVLSIGSGAALAADGPARSVIEDVYAAEPGVTNHHATGPGQPCLRLDPSGAVCASGLPALSGGPGLAGAGSAGARGRGRTAAAAPGSGPVGTPGANRTARPPAASGTGHPSGASGTAGTPGGGGPGNGTAPAPGAVPAAGVGDDRDERRAKKGHRGRGRDEARHVGDDRTDGHRGDDDSRGRGGHGGDPAQQPGNGEGGGTGENDENCGGGAPSGGGDDGDDAGSGGGKGGHGNGNGGGKGNGGGCKGGGKGGGKGGSKDDGGEDGGNRGGKEGGGGGGGGKGSGDGGNVGGGSGGGGDGGGREDDG